MNDFISCFSHHSDGENCSWREAYSYLPLLSIWIGLTFLVGNGKEPKKLFVYDLWKTRIAIAILLLLTLSCLVQVLANWGNILLIITQMFAAISYIVAAVSIRFHWNRGKRIDWTLFYGILLLTCFQITLFVTKCLESDIDYILAVQIILLMAQTGLLTQLDKQQQKSLDESPELQCSWISQQLFSWMTPVMVTASKRPLLQSDLFPLRSDCRTANLLPDWEVEWTKERKNQKALNERQGKQEPASIAIPFMRTQKTLIVTVTCLRVLADVIHYINPLLLKFLIDFLSQPEGSISFPICLSCLMFISAEIRSFLMNMQIHGMFKLTVCLHTLLCQTIMRKTLKLAPKERAGRTSGEILNHAAVDVEKLTGCILFLQNTWSIPLQLSLAMILLNFTIGYAAIPGFIILLLFVPLNYYSSQYIKKAQMRQMKIKDERTKMSNELLNGIKVVKLYAWEETFEKKINRMRKLEVDQLKKVNIAGRVIDAANATAPFLVAISSFAAFVVIYGNDALTPSIAFVSLALFNQMRQPMRILGMLVNYLVQSMVSNKRLKQFLDLDEIDPNIIGNDARGNAIVFSNASFNWEGSSKEPLLHNINLVVRPGQLIAIVGSVGSGKSSIISAILGEMHLCSGSADVEGSIAYVPQQPWIFNKSLRENILFGRAYNKAMYDKITKACELDKDFSMMENGDETEIGENGVNLSGGQKARVELARSLYQDCSIYLFDDPLSAVDCVVGRAVFDKVLGKKGILRKQTRILVTHGLHYTKNVDHIVVVKDGRIVQTGDYETLKNVNGTFADLLREKEAIEKQEEEEVAKALSRSTSFTESVISEEDFAQVKKKQQRKQLIQKEAVETGRVKTGVYWLYMKSMGLLNSFGFFGFYILHYIFMIFRSLWLSDWSTENTAFAANSSSSQSDPIERLSVYGTLGLFEIAMILFSFLFLTLGSMKASLGLHNPMMRSILRAPITFFDTNPLGRIVNRLAKDLEVVDNLGNNFRQFTQAMLHVIMIFVLVAYAIPPFCLVGLPLLGAYAFIMNYFLPTIRQLRRLESVGRSPILSIFGEAIQGAHSIRAYKKTNSQCSALETATDKFTQSRYLSVTANRWCATRLELIGSTVVLSTGILGTISTRYFGLSPGMVGLSVSYALNITELLNMAIRMLGELETNIVSVERVKEYHRLPSEADWEADPGPPQSWPSNGRISIKNVKMRYREDLPLVLKGVSVEIESGQKVAIIGRTGSGKSSLTLGLFRMIEPAAGNFFIDNMATGQVGLHQLRSKMAIIPQDPVLFSGTLRFNLDPFDVYTDTDLWSALEKCQLKSFASSKPEGLSMLIAEGGKNMSIGERQLICLGRALLRGGHIVVLDEATAAVDAATDALVQDVVRKHFPTSTIIAIAHRLDTIADYDRILVLDGGEVVEFGHPRDLLEDPKSHYSQMTEKSKQM